MIASTVLAATIAAAQPQPAPAMDHAKMDHAKMDMKADKAGGKMDCCKDGCACCAKDKAKPTK
jgi:hypothetical protein